eukprot:SAG31_NODE_45497_length_258_cov_1.276730_1_plen_68_part_10
MRLLSLRDINILSFVSQLVLVLSFVPFHSNCLSVLSHIASQSQRLAIFDANKHINATETDWDRKLSIT